MNNDRNFTPALGRSEWTPLYDSAIALMTRERRWRQALLCQAAPKNGDRILDVGCGTGTFLIMLKGAAPGAEVVGIDPDDAVLGCARAKAAKAGLTLELQRGFARDADASGLPFKKVVSSLVFHQVPLAEKVGGLSAIRRALLPGGELHVADYGLQRTTLMRGLFGLIKHLDGPENTTPNAEGVLPRLMCEAGFVEVTERRVIATPTGSISLYSARKPFEDRDA